MLTPDITIRDVPCTGCGLLITPVWCGVPLTPLTAPTVLTPYRGNPSLIVVIGMHGYGLYFMVKEWEL